jgi:hypothetical protein
MESIIKKIRIADSSAIFEVLEYFEDKGLLKL